MGGLFSSKSKSTSTSSTKIPGNFQGLMDSTIAFTNQALNTPFEAYNAPRIAELSANEQAGIASAGANAGMYQDLINMAAMNNAAMQVQGGVPGQGDLDAFMNPYVDYVLGNTLSRLQEQSDINMTKIGSTAGMSGAFGGTRHGVLEGANLAELLKSAQEASANTYSDAFDKGMANWFNSQNLRRGTISDALGIAQGGQAYNINDINALMSTGLTERTRDQGVLDFAFSEFLREQQDPFTKAGFAGSIMSSYPTDLFTRTNVTTTTNTPSPFSQIAGIGLAAAGLMTGNPAALAGLGAGAGSLGSGAAGGMNSLMGLSASGMPLNRGIPMRKGGLVKGYKDGGKVEDPIGDLIRQLEEQEQGKKRRRLSDTAEYKYGRKSTNVEDRRGWHPSRVPSQDMLNALGIESARGKSWEQRDDLEAEYYRNLKKDWSNPTLGDFIDKITTEDDFANAMKLLYPSKYAKGGKVKAKHKYGAGSLVALEALKNNDFISGFGNAIREKFGPGGGHNRDNNRNTGITLQPRQAFDWDAFIQRYGLENFQTPKFPNAATPRLPAQGPDLGMFVQALQSKMSGQTPFAGYGAATAGPGLKSGGVVKRFNNGGRIVHDGSPEDLLAAMDFWDEVDRFTPTEDAFDGTHVTKVDPERVFQLALQKHESGAKDYDNPNYKARPYDAKEKKYLSTAFGAGQWLIPTWNELAKKSKGAIPVWSEDRLNKGEIPSKEIQDKAWKLWNAQLAKSRGDRYDLRFAEHQVGKGGLDKLLAAKPNQTVASVLGDEVARNVSAKGKTIQQYLASLNDKIAAAHSWERKRLIDSGGNLTDVVSAEPAEDVFAYAQRRPQPVSEEALAQALANRLESDGPIATPDGRMSRVRKGSLNDTALTGLEIIRGGADPDPIHRAYLEEIVPELQARRKKKVVRRKFNEGGEVYDYSMINPDGKMDMTPDELLEAWKRIERNISKPLPHTEWNGAGPMRNMGSSLIDFISSINPNPVQFRGENTLEASGPYGTLPKESDDLRQLRSGFTGHDRILDMSPYGKASAEEFNVALEQGEPSGAIEVPAREELAAKEDELTTMFKQLIKDELEARKTRGEDDGNNLFGMRVNMPLIKMGLSILANSGYPNSAGEAIGKGVLGVLNEEDQKRLMKQEKDANKLKELVNLRYMQAMIESMDPQKKLELQNAKMQQDFIFDKLLADEKMRNEILMEQIKSPIILDRQKQLAKFNFDLNNQDLFGSLGPARTDLTGGE